MLGFSILYTRYLINGACESQLHKGHLTSKLNYNTVPVLPSLIYPFHLSPSPVHPTGSFFCFFPGFLAIFISLSWNNNNIYSLRLNKFRQFVLFSGTCYLLVAASGRTSHFVARISCRVFNLLGSVVPSVFLTYLVQLCRRCQQMCALVIYQNFLIKIYFSLIV